MMSKAARQRLLGVLVIVAGLLPGSSSAQPPSNSCAGATADAADPSLQLSLKDGRTRLRDGETVRLVLTFSSTAAGAYDVNTRNSVRIAGDDLETFCVEPSGGRDPLDDYYRNGLSGFAGSIISGSQPLTATGYRMELELNEWQQLPPGRYRLRVLSRRVGRAATSPEVRRSAGDLLLFSNTVDLRIVTADAAWQAGQLAAATTALDAGSGDEARQGARVLRFLGSEQATRELARRFWTVADQPFGSDLRFGLIASAHRQTAIEEMTAAISDPSHPVTREFLATLATLEIQSNPDFRLPPFDEGTKERWNRLRERKVAAYEDLVARHMNELATHVAAKTGAAGAVSLNTLLTASDTAAAAAQDAAVDRAALRQMLLRSWEALPVRTQGELIGYRWDDVAGPEWLPILRQIVSGPRDILRGPDARGREQALIRLYELSPGEGREAILREIAVPVGDIGIRALGVLPDRELPPVEESILARVRSNAAVDLDYHLLARYATKASLVDVRELYERSRGRWACTPQVAMLRYFLRVDSTYGIAQVTAAMGMRQFTGCYQMLLPALEEALKVTEIERLAIAALDDPAAMVVRSAAAALARYGSAAAEQPLWDRLQMSAAIRTGPASEQPVRAGGMPPRYAPSAGESLVADALTDALARGQGWVLSPDGLARLQSLATPQRQVQLKAHLADWQRGVLDLWLSWQMDARFHYTVAAYSGDTIEMLVEKLGQFPIGTSFQCRLAPRILERHRAELELLQQAARAAGLRLELNVVGQG